MTDANMPLFVRADGKPMCFYLPPSVRDKGGSTRAQIRSLIEEHGGKFRTPVLSHSQAEAVVQLVHVDDAGNEKAVETARERGHKLYFCTYVSDSVEKGKLMNLEDYEVRPTPKQEAPKRARFPWTPEEDAAILRFASKSLMARRGDTVWEDAEKLKITRHSWQAMKERYTKHLAPAQAAKVPPTPFSSAMKDPLLTAQLGRVASPPGPRLEQRLPLGPLASPDAQSGQTSSRPASGIVQGRAEGLRRKAEASAVPSAAEGLTSEVRPDVSQAGPDKSAPGGRKQQEQRGAKSLQSPVSTALPLKKPLPLKSPLMQAPRTNSTQSARLLDGGQTGQPPKESSDQRQAPMPAQKPPPIQTPPVEAQNSKPADKVRPPSASISNGQSSKQHLERLQSPSQSMPSVRGAAVLSASGKARVLRAVPPQNLQHPGTAAAGQDQNNERQETEKEAPSLLHQDPFTQAPDVASEPLPWDFSELEEEPLTKDDADESDAPGDNLTELGQQQPEEALGASEIASKKRSREEPKSDGAGKKQRTGGAQALVEREGVEGKKPRLMDAIMEEGEGDMQRKEKPANVASGVRTATGSTEESERRAENGQTATDARVKLQAGSKEGAMHARGDRHKETRAGEFAEDGLREDHSDEEGEIQSLTRKQEESRQRRLRRANGELVGGSKKQVAEPPASQTPEVTPGRVSEIRTWVARFMEEYSCSRVDVIRAVTAVSGNFEAARALLDRRVRNLVKERSWSLEEDRVLLKQRPLEKMRADPTFHDLVKVFGQDGVQTRLKFLGRLG